MIQKAKHFCGILENLVARLEKLVWEKFGAIAINQRNKMGRARMRTFWLKWETFVTYQGKIRSFKTVEMLLHSPHWDFSY